MGLRYLPIYVLATIAMVGLAWQLGRGLFYLVLIPVNAVRLAATIVRHGLSRAYRPIALRLISRRHRAS